MFGLNLDFRLSLRLGKLMVSLIDMVTDVNLISKIIRFLINIISDCKRNLVFSLMLFYSLTLVGNHAVLL